MRRAARANCWLPAATAPSLRAHQPALLAIWGRYDPFFAPAGAQAYRRDLPDAEVVLLDTGHFALEEELDTIADHIDRLLGKHLI